MTILEASNRVGGRIQTYRDLDSNLETEFGPVWIPEEHLFTRELIQYFKLSLKPFELGGINFLLPKLFEEILNGPMQDLTQISRKELIEKYDKYSVRQWMAQHANVSEDSNDLGANLNAVLKNSLVILLTNPTSTCQVYLLKYTIIVHE